MTSNSGSILYTLSRAMHGNTFRVGPVIDGMICFARTDCDQGDIENLGTGLNQNVAVISRPSTAAAAMVVRG